MYKKNENIKVFCFLVSECHQVALNQCIYQWHVIINIFQLYLHYSLFFFFLVKLNLLMQTIEIFYYLRASTMSCYLINHFFHWVILRPRQYKSKIDKLFLSTCTYNTCALPKRNPVITYLRLLIFFLEAGFQLFGALTI